jgi:hypothetical protein
MPLRVDARLQEQLRAAVRSPLQQAVDAPTTTVPKEVLRHMAARSVGLCHNVPGTVAVVVGEELKSPRIMRDTGSNTHLISKEWADSAGLQVTPAPARLMTVAGTLMPVAGRVEGPVHIVLAPGHPQHRLVQRLEGVLVIPGLSALCDVLLGTPADSMG